MLNAAELENPWRASLSPRDQVKTRAARRPAPQLSRYTAAVFSLLAKKTRFADPALADHWPTIVGKEIAKICRPGRLTGGRTARTLEIIVANGAAAAQTQFQAGEIIDRVNRLLGPDTIARVSIRQSGGTHQKIKSAELKADIKAGDGPLSSLEEALIRMHESVTKRTEND